MKFFTRRLYDAIKVPSETIESEKTEAEWNSTKAKYENHWNSIQLNLPSHIRVLGRTPFHDGIIKSIDEPNVDEVLLLVDCRNNPWGPRGMFQIHFTGVHEFCTTGTTSGDWWVYEEIHLHPQAVFEYHVLCERSEFSIAADDVRWFAIHQIHPPETEASL